MTRYRMMKLLRLLESNSFSDVRDTVLSPQNDRALRALISLGCVKPLYADNGIYDLTLTNRSAVYHLERTGLWINRIVSFVLGAVTPLLISILSHAIS